jgi:hypothetical protein
MSVSIKTLFLSLSSLCVTYPRWRSVRLKTQKLFFLVFLLSVEALLEADPDIFLICNIFFFSLSLFLCVESILGDDYSKQNYKKRFFLVFLLSFKTLLLYSHSLFFSLPLILSLHPSSHSPQSVIQSSTVFYLQLSYRGGLNVRTVCRLYDRVAY